MPVKSALEYNLLSHGKQPLWKAHRCRFVGSPDQKQVGYVVKFVGNDAAPALPADDALLGGVIVDAPTDEASVGLTLEGSFNENQIKYADGSKLSGAGIQRLSDLGIFLDPATSNPPVTGGGGQPPPTEGGAAESNPDQNNDQECAMRGSYNAVAQAFTASEDGYLHSVKFYLKRNVNTDPVQLVARLWDATGTVGQDAKPTALAPLATSKPLDSINIPLAPEGALFEFVFDGTFQLKAGQDYCIGAENMSASITGRISFGSQCPVGTHSGNYSERMGALWRAGTFPQADLTFYLYTQAQAGTPLPEVQPELVESLPLSAQNDANSYGFMANMAGCYQAFVATKSAELTSCKVSLNNKGAVTGDLIARICRVTGEVGTTAVPDEMNIELQSAFVPVTSIGPCTDAAGVWHEFDFTGSHPFGIVKGGSYALCIASAQQPAFEAAIGVGVAFDFDTGGAAHVGNGGYYNNTNWMWELDDMCDMVFELYGKPDAVVEGSAAAKKRTRR